MVGDYYFRDLLNFKNLIFLFMVVLSFLVVRPIILLLISSAIIAYASYPLYRWFNKRIRFSSVSAVITISGIIGLLVLGVLFFVLSFPFSEIDAFSDGVSDFVGSVIAFFGESGELNSYIQGSLSRIVSIVTGYVTSFLLSIPQFLFNVFLTFFFTFYFLKYGKSFFDSVVNAIKLDSRSKTVLIKRVKDATDASIYGFLFVPFVQGTLALVGFVVLGIPGAVALGVLTIFLALIPVLGPYLVWAPITVYYIFNGVTNGVVFDIVKGVLFGVYGLVVISHIDNILRARIVSRKTNVNPGVILAGIVGGLLSFGFVGILIGPIILSVAAVIFKSFGKASFK